MQQQLKKLNQEETQQNQNKTILQCLDDKSSFSKQSYLKVLKLKKRCAVVALTL